jgi:hypothetical protein
VARYEKVNNGNGQKTSGRSATDNDPLLSARVPKELIASVDKWAAERDLSRSEATRLLLEVAFQEPKGRA